MNIRVTVGKIHRRPLCFLGGSDRFRDARTGAEGERIFLRRRPAEHKNRENTLAYKERM